MVNMIDIYALGYGTSAMCDPEHICSLIRCILNYDPHKKTQVSKGSQVRISPVLCWIILGCWCQPRTRFPRFICDLGKCSTTWHALRWLNAHHASRITHWIRWRCPSDLAFYVLSHNARKQHALLRPVKCQPRSLNNKWRDFTPRCLISFKCLTLHVYEITSDILVFWPKKLRSF